MCDFFGDMEIQSCNLAIIGDGSVGKSSLIAAFRSEGFTLIYKQVIPLSEIIISLWNRLLVVISMKNRLRSAIEHYHYVYGICEYYGVTF